MLKISLFQLLQVLCMITSASTINFGGCYNSVLQAGDAITFGGERTSLSGNIGTAPGTSITAYWKGTHTAGSAHYADTYSTTCATDMISIANEASAGLPSCTSIVPELGGVTIDPGVYCTPLGAFMLSSGKTLTLDAGNVASAEFTFIATSTFTSLPYTTVKLINEASESNVYWSIGSSAIIGDYSMMAGNIFANNSITFNSYSTLIGRGLASAAITFASGSALSLPADVVMAAR